MGWDGPILTDSGGFQVFSLRHTAARIDDDGVRFRSVYDGSQHHFTPELAMRVQRLLGSDIAMAFDECPPAGVDRGRVEAAVRRTSLWARALPRPAARRGPARIRDRAGRHRPRPAPAQRRGDRRRSGSTATRSAASRWARSAAPMLETLAATDRAAARRPAALPDGRRRPGRPDRGHRARRRHVRLRAADAAGPHRLGARARRPPQPAKRRVRAPTRRRWSRAAPARPAPASRAPTSATWSPSRRSRGLRLLTIHNLHHAARSGRAGRAAIVAGRFARAAARGVGRRRPARRAVGEPIL